MAKSLFIGLIVFLVCVFACKQDGPEQLTFGVSAPFTGQEGAAVYGENIKQAVDLAVEEINASGGIKGRKLRPLYEDDQLLAPVAVAAVQKLATVHKVPVIIGPVASSSTIAASKIAEQAKVVLISPASTSNEISGLSPYVFRTIAPDNLEAEAMADFALERGHRRFGVSFVDNAGTRGPAEVFRKAIEARAGQIVAFEVVPQGSTDVRTQVTKLISAKPDAVYLLGYALELGSMIKQFREQDKKTPILSFQVMEEPKVREIAGSAAEGVIFTSPTIHGEFATGKPKLFIQKYKDKYGTEPGIFAANAYDAVYLMAQVMEEQGFEIERIQRGLKAVRGFEGASGTFDINEKGDSNQPPRFLVVRGGKVEVYSDAKPARAAA